MTAAGGEITAIGEPIRDLVDELSMLPQINRIVLACRCATSNSPANL